MDKQYLDFLKKDAPKKIREEEMLNESADLSEIELNENFDQEIELEIKRAESTRELFEDVGAAFGGAMAGAALAAPLITWAHKQYREIFGKANEACAKLGGKEGKMCRHQYKMKAAKAEISSLKYARSKCGKAEDRKACLTKINAKIKELQSKYPETQFKE